MNWNTGLLTEISAADDLKIAPYHPNGQTTGTPTWIWEVIVENRLFVRAYSGVNSRWYKAALTQLAGKIHAVGRMLDVTFSSVTSPALNEKIDEAYRQKYAQSRYMSAMISDRARAATVEILPRSGRKDG